MPRKVTTRGTPCRRAERAIAWLCGIHRPLSWTRSNDEIASPKSILSGLAFGSNPGEGRRSGDEIVLPSGAHRTTSTPLSAKAAARRETEIAGPPYEGSKLVPDKNTFMHATKLAMRVAQALDWSADRPSDRSIRYQPRFRPAGRGQPQYLCKSSFDIVSLFRETARHRSADWFHLRGSRPAALGREQEQARPQNDHVRITG